MSVIVTGWETAHLHGEAWVSHHRLRHRVFVDRLGWGVPSFSGLEYDQFDTPAATYILWLDGNGVTRGAARLIPTTQPYMVETLWPELIDGTTPRSDQVWEATRFVCERDLGPGMRRQIVTDLICGCQEFGIARGISRYLGVMPVGIFRNVIAAAGCPVTFLGQSKSMGDHDIAAAYIDVSPEVLASVRLSANVHRDINADVGRHAVEYAQKRHISVAGINAASSAEATSGHSYVLRQPA